MSAPRAGRLSDTHEPCRLSTVTERRHIRRSRRDPAVVSGEMSSRDAEFSAGATPSRARRGGEVRSGMFRSSEPEFSPVRHMIRYPASETPAAKSMVIRPHAEEECRGSANECPRSWNHGERQRRASTDAEQNSNRQYRRRARHAERGDLRVTRVRSPTLKSGYASA